MIRVVLGEDNVLVREGVRALLNSYEDIEVVGVAEDAPSLLATAAEVLAACPDRWRGWEWPNSGAPPMKQRSRLGHLRFDDQADTSA